MSRKRAIAAAILAFSLVGGLSACSVGEDTNKSSSTPGAAEITFLTFETPNLTPQYWDAAIKRVTDKVPGVTVKKLVAPSADRTGYAKQLKTSGQLPDVMIGVDQGGFAEAGDLYTWQPDELKDFSSPDSSAINGKIYQLPANTQTVPSVYYRKSMFAKAGITAPPTTYAGFLDACAKLKAKGVLPIVVGGGKDSFPLGMTVSAAVDTSVYQATPNWIQDRRAGTVKFSDPAFVDALQKVVDLKDKGYLDPKMISVDYAGTEQNFLKGKGAMYPMGSWFAAAADKSSIKDDIGVFSWPTADGKALVPATTGGGLEVNAKSKNLEAAKKFALAFQLDKENLDASVRSDALFPAIKGYSPPTDMGPVFKATYDMWAKAVQSGAVTKTFVYGQGGEALLPGVDAKVYTVTQDLILGRKSPQNAAKFLDAEWEKAS